MCVDAAAIRSSLLGWQIVSPCGDNGFGPGCFFTQPWEIHFIIQQGFLSTWLIFASHCCCTTFKIKKKISINLYVKLCVHGIDHQLPLEYYATAGQHCNLITDWLFSVGYIQKQYFCCWWKLHIFPTCQPGQQWVFCLSILISQQVNLHFHSNGPLLF